MRLFSIEQGKFCP